MYADDHQFHAAGSTVTEVYDKLIASAELASRWYRSNFLKENYDKYQTMTLGYRLRLITLTSTLIILDITKTSSNNCLFLTWAKATAAALQIWRRAAFFTQGHFCTVGDEIRI